MVNLVSHQHLKPDQTYIRLDLAAPVEGDKVRAWYALQTKPDYQVILDAVTDAFVSQKAISLFVASIKDGGPVEKFRFGEVPVLKEIAPLFPMVEPVLESMAVLQPAVPAIPEGALQPALAVQEATAAPEPDTEVLLHHRGPEKPDSVVGL